MAGALGEVRASLPHNLEAKKGASPNGACGAWRDA
jgi:hypothetical protein